MIIRALHGYYNLNFGLAKRPIIHLMDALSSISKSYPPLQVVIIS